MNRGNKTQEPDLEFLSAVPIGDTKAGFREPSGLTLHPPTGELWSVSDDSRRFFRIGSDGGVELVPEAVQGMKDMEGVTFLASGRMAAVQEAGNEFLILDPVTGETHHRQQLSDMDGYSSVKRLLDKGKTKGRGIEGLAADDRSGTLFAVREAEPRLLLEVSGDLQRVVDVKELTPDMGFDVDGVREKELDVSGLCHDPRRARLWISSDTGQCVFLYDPVAATAICLPLKYERDGKRKPVKNAEGVALNAAGTRLHIVTDDGKQSLLLTYGLPDPG